jgi:hypothetical protein
VSPWEIETDRDEERRQAEEKRREEEVAARAARAAARADEGDQLDAAAVTESGRQRRRSSRQVSYSSMLADSDDEDEDMDDDERGRRGGRGGRRGSIQGAPGSKYMLPPIVNQPLGLPQERIPVERLRESQKAHLAVRQALAEQHCLSEAGLPFPIPVVRHKKFGCWGGLGFLPVGS